MAAVVRSVLTALVSKLSRTATRWLSLHIDSVLQVEYPFMRLPKCEFAKCAYGLGWQDRGYCPKY